MPRKRISKSKPSQTPAATKKAKKGGDIINFIGTVSWDPAPPAASLPTITGHMAATEEEPDVFVPDVKVSAKRRPLIFGPKDIRSVAGHLRDKKREEPNNECWSSDRKIAAEGLAFLGAHEKHQRALEEKLKVAGIFRELKVVRIRGR